MARYLSPWHLKRNLIQWLLAGMRKWHYLSHIDPSAKTSYCPLLCVILRDLIFEVQLSGGAQVWRMVCFYLVNVSERQSFIHTLGIYNRNI